MVPVKETSSESKPEESVKIYSSEEIDLFLCGDRRNVDKLLLHGLNNIARILIPHIAYEDRIFDSLGTLEDIKIRKEWIDAEIRKKETAASFYEQMTLELGKKSAWVLMLVIVAMFVFWWNGHTPDIMHLPNPLGK
jgi:hypothetical protein